jgi:hypothetical protein
MLYPVQYDLPAVIKKIVEETGQKISYIGKSALRRCALYL